MPVRAALTKPIDDDLNNSRPWAGMDAVRSLSHRTMKGGDATASAPRHSSSSHHAVLQRNRYGVHSPSEKTLTMLKNSPYESERIQMVRKHKKKKKGAHKRGVSTRGGLSKEKIRRQKARRARTRYVIQKSMSAKKRQLLAERARARSAEEHEHDTVDKSVLSRFEVAWMDTARLFRNQMTPIRGRYDVIGYFIDNVANKGGTATREQFVKAARKCGSSMKKAGLIKIFDALMSRKENAGVDGELMPAGFAVLFERSKKRRASQVAKAAKEKAKRESKASRAQQRERDRKEARAKKVLAYAARAKKPPEKVVPESELTDLEIAWRRVATAFETRMGRINGHYDFCSFFEHHNGPGSLMSLDEFLSAARRCRCEETDAALTGVFERLLRMSPESEINGQLTEMGFAFLFWHRLERRKSQILLAASQKTKAAKDANRAQKRKHEMAARHKKRRESGYEKKSENTHWTSLGDTELSDFEIAWKRLAKAFESRMPRRGGRIDYSTFFDRKNGMDETMSRDEFLAAARKCGSVVPAVAMRRIYDVLLRTSSTSSANGELTESGFTFLFDRKLERRASQVELVQLRQAAASRQKMERDKLAARAKERPKRRISDNMEAELSSHERVWLNIKRAFQRKMKRHADGTYDIDTFFDRNNGPGNLMSRKEFITTARKCGCDATVPAMDGVFSALLIVAPESEEGGELTPAGFRCLFDRKKQRRRSQVERARLEKEAASRNVALRNEMAQRHKQRKQKKNTAKEDDEEPFFSKHELAWSATAKVFENKMSRRRNGRYNYDKFFRVKGGADQTMSWDEFFAAALKCGSQETEAALRRVYDALLVETPESARNGSLTKAGFAELFNRSKERKASHIQEAIEEKEAEAAAKQRRIEKRDEMAKRRRERMEKMGSMFNVQLGMTLLRKAVSVRDNKQNMLHHSTIRRAATRAHDSASRQTAASSKRARTMKRQLPPEELHQERVRRQVDAIARVLRSVVRHKRHLFGHLLRDARDLFDTADTNEDGVLTADEFGAALHKLGQWLGPKEVKEITEAMDADGDGVVQLDEFVDVMGVVLSQEQMERPTVAHQPRHQHAGAQHAPNYSDYKRVQTMQQQRPEELHQERVRRQVDAIAKVLRSALKHKRHLFGSLLHDFRELLEAADTNKDGRLSAEEFGKALHALGHWLSAKEVGDITKVMDTDGDGLVDLAEFVSAMEHIHHDGRHRGKKAPATVNGLAQHLSSRKLSSEAQQKAPPRPLRRKKTGDTLLSGIRSAARNESIITVNTVRSQRSIMRASRASAMSTRRMPTRTRVSVGGEQSFRRLQPLSAGRGW